MNALFLDIDGVLNGHEKMSNGYSKMRSDCVERLNEILRALPDCALVISSSWRYDVHSGEATLKGLQNLFLSHGLDCFNRIHGITESDEVTAEALGRPRADFSSTQAWYEWAHEHGVTIRRNQIYSYANSHNINRFVVLDDMDLHMPELILTAGDVGLTDEEAQEVIARLTD